MVNPKKVEKKLASLLTNGETTTRDDWNDYLKKRGKIATYKRNHPREFQSLTQQAIQVLEKIDRALYSDLVSLDKDLSDGVREAFRKKK